MEVGRGLLSTEVPGLKRGLLSAGTPEAELKKASIKQQAGNLSFN